MKKTILSTIILSTLFSASVFAEYSFRIPLEKSSLNFTQNSSVPDNGTNEPDVEVPVVEEPEIEPESPFNFSAFNGFGVFDWTQAGGDFQSNSFQSTLYTKVLLRGYGLHSIVLSGNQSELGQKYSKIVISTQSGTFDCLKLGEYSISNTNYNDGRGTVTETFFNCESANYSYSSTALGQEFSVSFQ